MKTYRAQITRDHISVWAEVIELDTGRVVRRVPCITHWTARRTARRLLKAAIRQPEYIEVVEDRVAS